jgi:hypothetical protein
LKLAAGGGRLAADIIPAIHFRKYTYFYGPSACAYIDGIQFESRADRGTIVNFPKPHYENGINKHSARRTNGWYKPTVRIFKNARTCLVNRGSIAEDLAPSYLLESLLYNVPDDKFGGSFQNTFIAAFNWIWGSANVDSLTCQNEQLKLFGNAPVQWSIEKARQFLAALKALWENW